MALNETNQTNTKVDDEMNIGLLQSILVAIKISIEQALGLIYKCMQQSTSGQKSQSQADNCVKCQMTITYLCININGRMKRCSSNERTDAKDEDIVWQLLTATSNLAYCWLMKQQQLFSSFNVQPSGQSGSALKSNHIPRVSNKQIFISCYRIKDVITTVFLNTVSSVILLSILV